VFKVEKKKVYFAMMKDSYEKWTFPKGHVEKGEEVEEAAARETIEELGLEEIMFLEDLGKISIWFRDRFQKKGKLINKDIHYYLFKTKEGAKLNPDPTQHAMDAKWVGIDQVLKMSDYTDLKTVISQAVQIIKKYEANNSKRKSKKK
jgi:8-oxo-dGTP pyrophosphatase MutT (NUDIX family)